MEDEYEDEIWATFKNQFMNILKTADNDYYFKLFKFLAAYENNVLLYGSPGFPTDLFIDELLKVKFNLTVLHKTPSHWNKDMVYLHNPFFLEINLMHHTVSKNLKDLSKVLTELIKTKNIAGSKHFIIIKHIHLLDDEEFISYRIILERFSNNVCFLCTAHNIDNIDTPILSRFSLFRVPLFTQKEIAHIFSDYLQLNLNKYLMSSRNIMKCLWISSIEKHEKELVTQEFCTLHFPPIVELVNKKSKIKLEDIRQISYKCFQYNISISNITLDLLQILPKNDAKRKYIVEIAADIDHKLTMTNKGREPLYIEAFLCQALL